MEVDIIAQFKPFEMDGIPMESEYMNWEEVIQEPYDKMDVDPYTRTRVILMNGIENNSVLTSHAVERMTSNPEIKKQMAEIRRADSQQTADCRLQTGLTLLIKPSWKPPLVMNR